LSLAIGRRGQNVRLASQLVGWSIDILTEETESERRTQEFVRLSELFVEALNVEEVIAHLLVTEGFASIEEVAFVPVDELASIEGFDEDIAAELRQRALDWLEERSASEDKAMKNLKVKDDLKSFDSLSAEHIISLAEQGVKTLDDLADLAADELIEMLPNAGFSESDANTIIMKARAHWFADEEAEQENDGEAKA